jgi:TPR repeat protein
MTALTGSVNSKGNLGIEALKRSATLGDAHATFELAKLYRYGWEVPNNSELALQLFTLAANKGHVGANIELGKIHLKGDRNLSVDINIDKAKEYFERALHGNLHYHAAPDYDPSQAVGEAYRYLKAVKAIRTKELPIV